MPPPLYRLQTLLEIRQRAEDAAKESFARAMKRLHDEEKLLEELKLELKRMIEDRHRRREEYSRKLQSGEMKVTDQSSANRFIDRLKEKEAAQQGKIDGQREIVREAEKALKRAQDELLVA